MSARMESSSSSSKVTVEYHDSSGVFPLIAPSIAARLPLRNLNWQSPSRPLRQIRQLHVDFVPDQSTETSLRPPAQHVDSSGPTSFDIVRGGNNVPKDAVKERRHQIPGLKTAPYLKLYVLRCDDKDTYKASSRKRLRDWLRENGPQADGKRGGSSSANHEACETLILHVVIPGTPAASEARWRESVTEPDELKERKTSQLKLPGKSTRTVFDRLRADFNESSGKPGAVDRVAQIRLRASDVPADLLPTPALAETLAETPAERELATKDLVDKLKSLILGPFDLRVRQYDADIAEQESRRLLPGFNFCTFFIHKEGLAKALESIGLVEDALVIYDELSLGLETAVRELASGQAGSTATRFAAYTDDIRDRILGEGKGAANGSHATNGGGERGAGLFAKDYRAKIVRSDISVFDFACYLFSRQQALILRLANTRAARAALGGGGGDAREGGAGEDLVLVSEVCWRAAGFLHNCARTLRQDLLRSGSSTPQASPPPSTPALSPTEIEVLVSAWTYAIAASVLAETAAPVLEHAQSDERQALADGVGKLKRSDFDFAMGASPYPQRSSSLIVPAKKPNSSAPEPARPMSIAVESMTSPPSSAGGLGGPGGGGLVEVKGGGVPGLPELATYRAELIMVQRRMLEALAQGRGWAAGYASMRKRKGGEEVARRKLEEVSLDEDNAEEEGSHEAEKRADEVELGKEEASARARGEQASGILLPGGLEQDLATEADFHAAYITLSEQAMRLFALATQTNSVAAILGDLAVLKRRQGDVAAAEEIIRHLLPSYETEGGGWSGMQAEMLGLHAECLRELGQRQGFVEVGLKLLGMVAGRAMGRGKMMGIGRAGPKGGQEEEGGGHGSGLLAEVVEVSRALAADLTRPLEDYFAGLELEREVMHLEEKDGFALRLRFRHVLSDAIELEQVSLRLVGAEDATTEIWLVSDGAVTVERGTVELDLETTATAFGPFVADMVVFKAGRLRFAHDFMPQTPPTLRVNDEETLVARPPLLDGDRTQPVVFVYPAEHAFDARVEVRREIRLDKPRGLRVELSSGWNEIASIAVRMKPTSAGLRLHLGDAVLDGVELDASVAKKAGQLFLGELEAGKSALVEVPYTVEQATPDISVRLEIRYETPRGAFSFLRTVALRHELPLDVDVDDVFHLETLFSNFTVRTMARLPLVLLETGLRASGVYGVEAPPLLEGQRMVVFADAPVGLLYKITRKEGVGGKVTARREASLALSLRYVETAELLAGMLRQEFVAALEGSGYQALARLLVPVVEDRCKLMFTGSQLEVAAMLDHFRVPSLEDFGWRDIIATLPTAVRGELTTWLRGWHEQHTSLAIDYEGQLAQRIARRITISVEVPTVDVVFHASLKLQQPVDVPRAPGATILTLGKPIQAQLVTKCTDAWSTRALFGTGKAKPTTSKQRFVLDVQADPESWLVGGPRRIHFTATADEVSTNQLTLIPLQLGGLRLPVVEIQPEPEVVEEGKSPRTPAAREPVSCETRYESGGRAVEVIRDVRTTRVHVLDVVAGDESRLAQVGGAGAEPG